MTFLEDLVSIRDALASEFRLELARRAALQADGRPVPVSYSIDGKSVNWTEYMSMMLGKIQEANDLVIQVSEPYEHHMRLYS